MIKNLRLILLFFTIFRLNAVGQLDITLPSDRTVYQRSTLNVANIYIGGSYAGQLDKIEARLITLDDKGLAIIPETATAWQTVATAPTKGHFVGTLANQKGGWYKLEVRAIQGGVQIGKISSLKVGVGEVFLMAGQSNAQGEITVYNTTRYDAIDDRVNSINLQNFDVTKPLQYPVFSHLDGNNNIAPTGYSAWCYGLLGSNLARKLNVPIAFYNAGVGNTSVFDWRASALGETDRPTGFDISKGAPFIYLKRALNYYAAYTGLRAILWHQGENDLGNFEASGIGPEIYRDNLVRVINQSRVVSNKNISWMIAQASRVGVNTSSSVTEGQKFVTDIPNYNVFAGPKTDNLQPVRDLGATHFYGEGLRDLANAWYNSIISNNFLANSLPQEASVPKGLFIGECANNNQISMQMPSGYIEYGWYSSNNANVTKSQNLTALAKTTYTPYMRDLDGKNYFFVPPVTFSPNTFSIVLDKSPTLCNGQILNVETNTFNNNYKWSNGSTEKSIPLTTPGFYNFTVNSTDVYNCINTATKSFELKIVQIPPTPTLVTNVSPQLCEGGSVTIKDKDIQTNYQNVWNNGNTTNNFTTKNKGEFVLKYKDNNNCESEPSNKIVVEVNKNPLKPTILSNGPTTFCEDKFVILAADGSKNYEWQKNGVVVPTLNTQFVSVNLPGNYRAKIINEFGCYSEVSDSIIVKTLALPPSPIVEANGPVAFCAGGSVELKATINIGTLVWSTAKSEKFSSERNIFITPETDLKASSTNTYFARTIDGLGCTSRPSEKILVTVRPNPSAPKVSPIGAYTLEAKTSILGLEGNKYVWQYNNGPIAQNTKFLKTAIPGLYKVKSAIGYDLGPDAKFECFSQFSENLDFSPTGRGLVIYTNPSKTGLFILEADSDIQNAKINIISLYGQNIYETEIELFDNQKLIDLSFLPNGEYKLFFQSQYYNTTKSIIINKMK